MEEIRLWKSGPGKSVRSMEAVSQLDTEIELEEMLVAHPELLETGLTLVGRQTPTAGGWLDLLGVDRDGRLVIFELKRGTIGRDAVAQVLDYASDISAMTVDALVEHVAIHSGRGGVKPMSDFRGWYEENFVDFQRRFPVRMALVGLGVDETALRIARFLESGGHPIEMITFHAFRDAKSTLLARQLPIQPTTDAGGRATKTQRWERVRQHVEESGLTDLFGTVRNAILEELPEGVIEDPLRVGVSLRVRGPRPYFGIFAGHDGKARLDISLNAILEESHASALARLEESVTLSPWRHGGWSISVESQNDWDRVQKPLREFAAAVGATSAERRDAPAE